MGVLILSLIVFAVICMFATYNSKNAQGFETYIIKAGRHYSKRVNRPLASEYKIQLAPRTLNFTAIFAKGCDYPDNNNPDLSEDINKLYGISYGLRPHSNSIRIGWRYSQNLHVVELFMYTYEKGKRHFYKLMNVYTYEAVCFSIFNDRGKAVLRIIHDDDSVSDFKSGVNTSWLRFKLFPYFGGTMPAPNDVKILLRDETEQL